MSKRNYTTDRIKMWREQDLDESHRQTLDRIEEFGQELFLIRAEGASPRYAYSVGNYDTSGNPELIVIGLTDQTAKFALNEAATLMRKGTDLTTGRHRDIVGEIEVQFRSVDPKWLHQAMPRTSWYYGQKDVPALQLIYPDLEGRFQDEEGFQEYFRQPILTSDHKHGTLEDDFWLSFDEASSLSRWKFSDSPHMRVYLSKTVQSREEAVTFVSHDLDDGAWQFLGDRRDEPGAVISCFHHPIDNDPTLEELHDLPLGWYAVRDKPGAPWQRFENTDDTNEES